MFKLLRHLWKTMTNPPKMLAPGKPAPRFEASDHMGRKVSSDDLAGKRYVLWFYPKADTPGWTLQGSGFRDRIRDFEERGVQVLGISFDDAQANRTFAERYDFPFPLLCDTDRAIGMAFGACDRADAPYAQRYTFVVSAEGLIEQAIDTKNPADQAKDLLASF